jgi:hypothetical protein
MAELTIAWLAAGAESEAPKDLLEQVRERGLDDNVVRFLLDLVGSAMESRSPPTASLPPSPPEEVAQALVARMAGTGLNESMLGYPGLGNMNVLQAGELGISGTGYLAEEDGPLLVAYAAAHPGAEGQRWLADYLDLHDKYQYVEYRNGSLWVLLAAVLRHPDPMWVRNLLPRVLTIALSGRQTEFESALPFAVQAWRAQSGASFARETLDARRDQAIREAAALTSERGRSDIWGNHSRTLAALAEAYSRILGEHTIAGDLLRRALALPFGYAGYQAVASLSLAASVHLCDTSDTASVHAAVKQAQRSSQNVQDPMFCARTSSRVRAMTERWFTAQCDPGDAIERLTGSSDFQDASCPALHEIGDVFALRMSHRSISIEPLRSARTLKQLAEVYQRPLDEFIALNPPMGPDEELVSGTQVNVPDPDFRPLLASRLAAEALVANLPRTRVVQLVQSLVPLAAADPTCMDSCLSRLVLAIAAARPPDPVFVEEFAEASRPAMERLARGANVPTGWIGPLLQRRASSSDQG